MLREFAKSVAKGCGRINSRVVLDWLSLQQMRGSLVEECAQKVYEIRPAKSA
jgi:hypothetical protein